MSDSVELLKDVVAHEGDNFAEAYPTGFQVFDEALLGGIRGGDLVVISGISGHGKTSFAQTLTYNLVQRTIPCLWFSYEVSNSHIQRKFLNISGGKDDFLIYCPMKTTSGRVDWIYDKVKEGVEKFGTKIVFIDHLDFLFPAQQRLYDNEAGILKHIVMELKNIAIKLNVCIVLMAHVKKVADEPTMSDIAGSSGIFQNADVVLIVYRIPKPPASIDITTGDLFTNQTRIKMVKNRVTGQSKFIMCEMNNDYMIPIVDDITTIIK